MRQAKGRPRGRRGAGGAPPGRSFRTRTALAAALLLAACGGDRGPDAAASIAADSASLLPRQTREVIFAGQRGGDPLGVSFAFRTLDGTSRRSREVRGWLGHGSSWEMFLDERWGARSYGSPWTIVPHDGLRVAAGGPNEIEALWFERGGRRLRLTLGPAVAEWTRGATARARLYSGSVNVGGETSRGVVLELLRLRRPAEDPPTQIDHLLLQSGDSVALFVAVERTEETGTPAAFAWLRDGSGTREWSDVRLIARGGRSLPEARREIPRGWSVAVPEAGIRGEVRPLAFAAEIGLERGGLRGVEARYTVTGWLEIGGRRLRVDGAARHAVD